MATKHKKDVPPEVRAYFQEIGRKRGNALKAKHGSDYFKKIAAMRKTHGRQGKGKKSQTAEESVDKQQA